MPQADWGGACPLSVAGPLRMGLVPSGGPRQWGTGTTWDKFCLGSFKKRFYLKGPPGSREVIHIESCMWRDPDV